VPVYAGLLKGGHAVKRISGVDIGARCNQARDKRMVSILAGFAEGSDTNAYGE